MANVDVVVSAETVIAEIVRAIVDYPDQVHVETEHSESGVLLKLHTAPDDVGIVVGKGGRTIRSLRTVVRGLSVRSGYDISIDVAEIK